MKKVCFEEMCNSFAQGCFYQRGICSKLLLACNCFAVIVKVKIAGVNQITEELRAEYYILRSTNTFIPRTDTAVRGKLYVPIYKMFDKTGCSNYKIISLLSTANRFVSNISPAALPPYVGGIIGDYSLNSDVLTFLVSCFLYILAERKNFEQN
jgi:hypothetical protein